MPEGDANKPFRLGTWLVQPGLNRLSDGDQIVALEPRVMGVLVCLASRPGKILSADELLDTIWHGRAHADNTIYQAVAGLRNALGDDVHQPRYIETIPKKGYRLLAPVVFPEDDETGERTLAPPRRALIAAIGIAALLAGGTYLLWPQQAVTVSQPHAGSQQSDSRSIAVLPFVDMSEDRNQEYLGDGIAEELIHTLSNLPDMRVIARSSSFSFKGQNADIETVGQKLNVDAVLEGSVRTSGNRLRVTAQLVNVADGYHLWSETYERDFDDVFAIQDDIAGAISDALNIDTSVDRASKQVITTNAEAYKRYMLGRHHWAKRTETSLNRAIDYFQQAIDLDPSYALAYTGIADAYMFLEDGGGGYGTLSYEEMLAKAEPAIQKALELGPNLAEAYVSLGMMRLTESVHLWGTGQVREVDMDYSAAEAAFRRAIELNPNHAMAHVRYGQSLNTQDRKQERLVIQQHALALDPLSPFVYIAVASSLGGLKRFPEQEFHLKKAIEIDPEFWIPYSILAQIYWLSGQLDESVRWWKRKLDVLSNDPRHQAEVINTVSRVYLDLGDYEAAEEWLNRAVERDPDGWSVINSQAHLSLALGQYAETHKLVDKMLQVDNPHRPRATTLCLVALYEMVTGNDEYAQQLYEQAEAASTAGWAGHRNDLYGQFLEFGYVPAVNLAHLYYKSGDADRGDTVLGHARVYIQSQRESDVDTPGLDYVEAGAHAVSGDTEEAIRFLRKAVDGGWSKHWFAERDPNLVSLYDDPEFKQILADLKARVSEMRERLRLAEAEEKQRLFSATEE